MKEGGTAGLEHRRRRGPVDAGKFIYFLNVSELKSLQEKASKLFFCIHRDDLLQSDDSRHVGVYCGRQSEPFASCVPTSTCMSATYHCK